MSGIGSWQDLVRTNAYIDGRWHPGSGERFVVDDPATGNALAEVARCGEAETEAAIAAAGAAARRRTSAPRF